jgi:hypothetical protein
LIRSVQLTSLTHQSIEAVFDFDEGANRRYCELPVTMVPTGFIGGQ